jgi:transcription initiation factor TFIIB
MALRDIYELRFDEDVPATERPSNGCPECGGLVHTNSMETVCETCGLVVAENALDQGPSLQAHAPTTSDRSGEWACEPVNDLRVDKGLVTTFFLGSDGKGNSLSPKARSRMSQLKRQHKRFTMANKRDQRLNEGFRDIGMCGANLGLPEHVQVDAARYLQVAKRERLPGGRMAWEALAAGAVLLTIRETTFERSPAEIAQFAKTNEERLCAAARKLRLDSGVDAPVVRPDCVDLVVCGLETVGVELSVARSVQLVRVADRLMRIADTEPVGPGTSRLTIAGAAVYAADRLTSGKWVTQAEIVAAVEVTLPSSQSALAGYARELYTLGEASGIGATPALEQAAD